ncbi:MAG: pyrroline-5-carboxylate reductase [Lysobacterales bacterium]|jgi:pyrroline-5-carboxylate reductase
MLITFIGGGNMASALVSGLVNPHRSHLRIRVSDPNVGARERLESTFGVETFSDSRAAAEGADVVVLAIKPQNMPEVLERLHGLIRPGNLVLSIAAGTPIEMIERGLGGEPSVIRSMPNTPALIGHGIAGVVAGRHCLPHHRGQAEEILCAAGDVVWLDDEGLMDAVTAISGSGPAYFFLMTEALTAAGRQLGLSAETAERLAMVTCFGAGAMVNSSGGEVAELRRRVTSPGGTTEAALAVFEAGRFQDLVLQAARAARDRGRELAGS